MDAVKIKGWHPRYPILDYVPTLSNIALRWMIRELYEADKRCNLNIRWRPVQLARYGIYLPPLSLTNNDDPNEPNSLEITSDEEVQRTRRPIPPATRPPVVTHYRSTAEATQMRQNDRRRAEFTRCLKYESGVLIDLQHHEADLKAPITDQLWMWERIWKWDGMQRWRGTSPITQATKWMGNGTNTLITMMLWWILELWPHVKSVRSSGTTYFWQSKFQMAINMFRGREITTSERVDIPGGASPQWKQFIRDRMEIQVHDSVIERTKEKRLDYWPRPWPKKWKGKGLPGDPWKMTY